MKGKGILRGAFDFIEPAQDFFGCGAFLSNGAAQSIQCIQFFEIHTFHAGGAGHTGVGYAILIGQIDMQVVWNREYMAAAQIVGFDHIMHGIFHPVRFSAGFQQPAANAGCDLQ